MEFCSVNKLLEKSFKSNWNHKALSNFNGLTLKYSELAKKIAELHVKFAGIGIEKGDKIAICGRNQVNWAVSFLAAMTYGAVPVPLLHEFKPENIHYLVDHSDAVLLFVDEAILDNLSESEMPQLKSIVQLGNLDAFCDKTAFDERYPQGFYAGNVSYHVDSPEELALINYTSGTSGFSKGVMLPYRSVYTNIVFAHETAEPQLDCNSSVVSMLPSAHMYGLMFEFLFQMSIGSHVHFLTKAPSPKVILNAFEQVKPDIIIAVPLIIEKVYKMKLKPVIEEYRTPLMIPFVNQTIRKRICNELVQSFGGKFEEIILGGAPFNPEVEKFLRDIGFPFTVGYGMTECGPIITYSRWNKAKLGSAGVAIPGCTFRIDSPNPHKIPGEIQVKGDNVFLGYYKNRKATKAAFTNDDWFKTGDMGIMDSDGYLYIKGRLKCMILGPSGQNIYPEELEAVINGFKYVVDSLVIEDNGGLTALIYADERQGGNDGMNREELEEAIVGKLPEMNALLPSYAQIRKIEFMPEDFERTPKRNIKRYLYQRN